MNYQSPNTTKMQHSILLSEETQAQATIEVSKKTRKKEIAYPKWINESSLLSVSILSFCTLLVLLGSPLWIAIGLAISLLGLQIWAHLNKKMDLDFKLDSEDVETAITRDLYTKE